MNLLDVLQILSCLTVLLLIAPPLGRFLFRVIETDSWRPRLVAKLETAIYRVCGVDETRAMLWREYGLTLVLFNLMGLIVVFLIQILQSHLPLNPQGLANVSWHSALNTAISFVTNTNWQGYSGETTMSYFSQMVALTVQNFLSAATGMGVGYAICRGLTNRDGNSLGNFWKDLTRSTIYVLLPFSLLLSIFLISQGVIQNFDANVQVVDLEGQTQIIPQGPVASQIAIKQLGTNGGGYFGVNGAHPFENPTPLSNWVQLMAILLIPAGFVFMFGEYAKNRRQAWSIFSAMFLLLVAGLVISLYSESLVNPILGTSGVMEGKETRFGVTGSVLWSVFTTAASNGSVNSMHSSLSPLSGAVSLFNILLGEVIFGGVGAGLYGMFLFVILTVFLSGLMVGRTPEFLGKKIESREIQMVILAILIPNAAILLGAGISAILPVALRGLANQGPHGLTEILYAYASAAGNNGSAFAGLSVNTVYYNLTLGVAMLLGRFGVLLPVLAIAGSMVGKKSAPPGPGTFATDSALFIGLLIGVLIIVGGLTFLPALALGPIVEHFLMLTGRTF